VHPTENPAWLRLCLPKCLFDHMWYHGALTFDLKI